MLLIIMWETNWFRPSVGRINQQESADYRSGPRRGLGLNLAHDLIVTLVVRMQDAFRLFCITPIIPARAVRVGQAGWWEYRLQTS